MSTPTRNSKVRRQVDTSRWAEFAELCELLANRLAARRSNRPPRIIPPRTDGSHR